LYTTITPRGRDISAYNNSIEYLRIYRHNSYKFLKKERGISYSGTVYNLEISQIRARGLDIT